MSAFLAFTQGFQTFFGIYTLALLLITFLLGLGACTWIHRPPIWVGGEISDGHRILAPGISIISPAFNEAGTIMRSISSLLSVDYPERELIIVNDGSGDETLEVLIHGLDLYRVPETPDKGLSTRMIRGIYRSRRYPDVRVIDKENGGKADALNAGVNAAHYTLICTLDADTLLPSDALLRLARPFGEIDHLLATGGMVRLLNGCEYSNGTVSQERLPRSLLARFQTLEYMRSFIYGRIGWCNFGALLIISGAFGLFSKEALLKVGGYQTESMGEDMELIVRMHRIYSTLNLPYRIEFVPDAVCWTEAPEDLRSLRNQRIRWQRGLGESLMKNRGLFFSLRGGIAAWLAWPFYLIFELLGPLIELMGVSVFLLAWLQNSEQQPQMLALMILMLGVSLCISSMALLMDASILGPNRRRPGMLLVMILLMLPETLFYRVLINFWRTQGLALWLLGSRPRWGEIRRLKTFMGEG
jgi:cellulose synthase/poly-beta-1,6-N-acetylglucosamine synthase-like glycosyltransferase